MKRPFLSLALLVSWLGFAGGASGEEPVEQAERVEIGQPAPPIRLTDPAGTEYDSAELDKPLIALFFRGAW